MSRSVLGIAPGMRSAKHGHGSLLTVQVADGVGCQCGAGKRADKKQVGLPLQFAL